MRSLLALGLAVSCFFACTHPYREQKLAQERALRSMRPRAIAHAPKTAATPLRSLKVHAYADPDYRAQNQGFRGKLADLIAQANQVLAGAFSARLELESVEEWDRACPLTDLDACLTELATLDPGASDVWVLGLVGSMPQLTQSFDDLGRALTPGRHMILRGMSDLDEREGVEQFDRVSAVQRRRVVRQRREHKGTVVLLHEWAHTLGARHEREPGFILNAAYDSEQSTFPPEAIALMQGMLDAQLASLPEAELRERYRTLVEQHANGWEPRERESVLAELSPAARSTGRAHSQAVVAEVDDPALSGLTGPDRGLYARATAFADDGDIGQGLPIALDLAKRYRDVYPVQHLACGLAMQRGGDMLWIESVCQPALDLVRQQKP